jgi:hypothetical protein
LGKCNSRVFDSLIKFMFYIHRDDLKCQYRIPSGCLWPLAQKQGNIEGKKMNQWNRLLKGDCNPITCFRYWWKEQITSGLKQILLLQSKLTISTNRNWTVGEIHRSVGVSL